MVGDLFKKDYENLTAILNSKQIIQNLSYKLEEDENCKKFFSSVYDKSEKIEELEHMDRWQFIRDIKEMSKILKYLSMAMENEWWLKDKSADDILKCCSVFPDNIGKRILIQMSYIPLLNGMIEKIEYEEFIDKKIDDSEISDWENARIVSRFPKDENFVDYKRRNEFIIKTENEYKENNMGDLSLTTGDLIKLMRQHPKVMQRPIVIHNNKAVIGRPPESVLDIL